MHKNLIILAGGMSSRMKKETQSDTVNKKDIEQANQRTKGLISVGNDDRPILDYLLYNAKKAGYTCIYIVVNEKGLPLFKQFYGSELSNNTYNELQISYIIQRIPEGRKKPLGTADALFQSFEQYPALKNDFFTVCNSDNLYSVEALNSLRLTEQNNAFINYNRATLEFSTERISRFAITKLNSKNYLEAIIEKPNTNEVDNYKDTNGNIGVSMNIFKFSGKDFYSFIKECPIHPVRNEKEIPVALLNMVKAGFNVLGISLSQHVPDLTAKEDIAVVREYLQKNYPTLDW